MAGGALVLVVALGALAGQSVDHAVLVEENVEATMRDGVVLRADLYRPDAPGTFPALLKRTPYSKAAPGDAALYRRLAGRGYVVAVQDTRGRFMSEGVAVPHDEAEDGYDSVEWLASRPFTNGRVGMFGGSYAATTQLTAAGLAPPSLVALFPSSSYASRYDMVFQGGAFYLLDGLRWNLGQAVDVRRRVRTPEISRDAPVGLGSEESRLVRDRWVWHLPLRTMNVGELSTYAPGYFEMLAHPSYDAFWKTYDVSLRHDRFRAPALHLTGWYDSLLVGTLRNFEGLRGRAATSEARDQQYLVVGPWTHARPSKESTRIGGVDFGPEAGLDSDSLMEEWLDHWLKGTPSPVVGGPRVRLFVMGENRWREENEWPLSRAEPTSLFLRSERGLSREAPGGELPDRYEYDPRDPVPTPSYAGYSRAPMEVSPLEARDDVLIYTSPPLEEPLEVTGYVELALWAASSAPDTDFTGRLVDVFPDGSTRALTDGILRARYRKGFDEPVLLEPGEPTELRLALGATSNVFLPGHRIRLHVSSSNFPRYDRNPNTGAAFGEDDELRVASQTVFHDSSRPSRLVLPVVPRPEEARRRLGYTAESFERERRREHRLAARISRERISASHQKLTERPHRAGTEGSRAVAELLVSSLRSAGLDVEVHEYEAHLSAPKRVAASLDAPVAEVLEVREPSDPRDPQSSHPELDPGFIGYSASGTVTGEVVHVGYGLPDDYERLAARRIDVAGRIVLARYGRSHRAVKVHTAQQNGAVGIVLYSDPEDDGAGRGEVWPDGPWRGSHQVQRGNAKFSWLWHGDPLTPGVAATPDAPRLDPAAAPTLPAIPALPLSAVEAAKIRRHLRDGLGPGPARVTLEVEMDDGLRTIRNVVGTLRGREEPDRWVVLGTHHDAWTFGGVDPGSAASVLLEVGHVLGSLAREGERPARSILLAFWDAEEYGLVGSTEYAEEHVRELREKAVVYVNSDMYNGERLVAGGTPSLRDFVVELARELPGIDPPRDLNALGSGADFVPFQDFVGLPTLSLELLFEGSWGFGTYHSNYDSRLWMTRHGDDGFRRGARLARLLGTAALRLAEAPVLPYRFSYYAGKLVDFVDLAEEWGEGRHRFERLRERAVSIREKSGRLEERLDELLEAGRVPASVSALNDRLMRIEHAFVDETEPPDERWYRHVVYGWNVYALYSGQPFPGLAAALGRGNAADVERERARIERALDRVSERLDEASSLLP